jgi:hypothetical protein
MAAELDIFRSFQECSWRDIAFPVVGDRQFGFQHEHEEHRFIFKDVQLIESLGRRNPTWSYEIPFREGVARGRWKNLFTEVYPKFLAACYDRTAGTLVDYVHGPKRVKCTQLRESLSRQSGADGVSVTAEFVLAPLDSETDLGQGVENLQGAQEAASSLDRNLDSGNLSPETRAQLAELNRDPGRGKTNIFDVPHLVGSAVLRDRQRITAQMQDVTFRLNRTVDTLDAAADPSLAQERQAARSLALAAFRFADDPRARAVSVIGGGRKPNNIRTVESDTTVSALAAKYSVPMSAFLILNPSLASSPRVKRGTKIRTPSRART